eukprot:11398826-Alexandrium_andersonii.AAC.1
MDSWVCGVVDDEDCKPPRAEYAVFRTGNCASASSGVSTPPETDLGVAQPPALPQSPWSRIRRPRDWHRRQMTQKL